MPRIIHPPLPFSPHACLVTGSADGEFIDFERDFIGMDPRIVLRKEVVEEAARECCGMVSLAEVKTLDERIAKLSQELDQATADVALIKGFEARFGRPLEAGATAGVALEAFEPAEADAIEIETASPAGEGGTPNA